MDPTTTRSQLMEGARSPKIPDEPSQHGSRRQMSRRRRRAVETTTSHNHHTKLLIQSSHNNRSSTRNHHHPKQSSAASSRMMTSKKKTHENHGSPTSTQDLFATSPSAHAVGLRDPAGFRIHPVTSEGATRHVAMPSLTNRRTSFRQHVVVVEDAPTLRRRRRDEDLVTNPDHDDDDAETMISTTASPSSNDSDFDKELLQELLQEDEQYTVRHQANQEKPKQQQEKGVDKKESREESSGRTFTLRRDLFRARRLVEVERSQKKALQQRLKTLEAQVKKELDIIRKQVVKSSSSCSSGASGSSNRASSSSNKQRVLHLTEELRQCKQAHQEEKLHSEVLSQELDLARMENRKAEEKRRLLMFQHIPTASDKFQDIGAVDYTVVEKLDGQVADYQLGKSVGEGHFGKVQQGRNETTGLTYAVKSIHKDKVTRFKDLQQLALEVQVLKHYPHPNIIQLHEVIHAPESIYIITEMCSMDLHTCHNSVGLLERQSRQVVYGILRPLAYLHSVGICHLDLKPENILLDQNADPKNLTYKDIRLCDFGLANRARNPDISKEIIRKGYACGTPGFYAPEMVLRNEFEGRLADMWSLGCIILEITLGFTQEWISSYDCGEKDSDSFKEGLEGCLAEISPEEYPHHKKLLDIIHSCLTIEPEMRVDSKAALRHSWFEGLVVDADADHRTAPVERRRVTTGEALSCDGRQPWTC